jgi:hypothetical protein
MATCWPPTPPTGRSSTSPQAGKQVRGFYACDDIGQEPPGNGDLFDVAVSEGGTGVLFVNDGTNVLDLLH